MGGGAKGGRGGGWSHSLMHSIILLPPSCHPGALSRPHPPPPSLPPLPMPAPYQCAPSLQNTAWLKEGEDTWAGRTGSSHVRRYLFVLSRHQTRPPAPLAVFSEGFPFPPRLLIVKMRSLIGGWVKSPVISAGSPSLIERYHKNLPGVWFMRRLLGAPFVPWQSPAHGHTAHFTFTGGD